jgi:hypothetical protein
MGMTSSPNTPPLDNLIRLQKATFSSTEEKFSMSTLYTVFGDLMEVLCTLYLVLEYFIRRIRP